MKRTDGKHMKTDEQTAAAGRHAEPEEEGMAGTGKKQKNPALVIRDVMLGLFLFSMAFSAFKLGSIMVKWHKSDKAYHDLSAEVVSTPAPTPVPTEAEGQTETVEKEHAPIVVDMDTLLERNPDTVAWLYCEDTPINFALVQAADNYTYQGRDYDRISSIFGWTFMDYRCEEDFSSPVSAVYGHNMQNGSVFAVLEKYQNQQFYDEHPVMWLLTPEGDYKVELMAGIFLTGTEPAYAGYNGDEEGFRSFLESAVRNSTFVSAVETEGVERTVMLSTCSNARPDERYVVIGALRPLDN